MGRNLVMHTRIAVMKALNRQSAKATPEPRRKPAKGFWSPVKNSEAIDPSV
jgi:hypothetical protein